MSEVKRFDVPSMRSLIQGEQAVMGYEAVIASDYDALAAEAKALREEVVRLLEDRARFPDKPDDIGRMIGAHIENLKHVAEESRRMCLKAMRERDVVEQDLEALRAMAVVVPDAANDRRKSAHYCRGWNACLDELARLNGMTVSEGLVRRLCEPLLSHADYVVVRNELRALLGEEKEHE